MDLESAQFHSHISGTSATQSVLQVRQNERATSQSEVLPASLVPHFRCNAAEVI